MPGHVFVIRGNLTRLACDAVILPCDVDLNVSSVWRDFLSDDLPPVPYTNWLRLTGETADESGIALPESKERRVARENPL